MNNTDSETSALRRVLLVTKYTRLEQYVDQRCQAELRTLGAFEQALRSPEAWTREFTERLLAERGIAGKEREAIPEYYLKKFCEHYRGLAHVTSALDAHEQDIGSLNVFPFKDYLRLIAPAEDMVRRKLLSGYSLAIIAAGDETFKAMAFDLEDALCVSVKTAESSAGFFSSCTGEDFPARLEDLVARRYSTDDYYPVETMRNGLPLDARTLAEVSLHHSVERWNSSVRFRLSDGQYSAEHTVSSGLVVSPLLGVHGWIENEVHDLRRFRQDYQAAVSCAMSGHEPCVAWAVRSPRDREARQYGFTPRLDIDVLSPATLCVGDEASDTVKPGERLTFKPAEEPVRIVRFRRGREE